MEDTRKPSAVITHRNGQTELIFPPQSPVSEIKYVARQHGRCAVEYRREDLDAILPNYTNFLVRDQIVGLPIKLESRPFGVISQRFYTCPGFGTYGMEPDGTFTLLVSIVDSSD